MRRAIYSKNLQSSKKIEFNFSQNFSASIGQVHRGVLLDGTHVAIKIQYPGVGKSIESDIDNLVSMLKVWDVFPKGISPFYLICREKSFMTFFFPFKNLL